MSNHEIIRSNIQDGDILLVRDLGSPDTFHMQDRVVTHWDESYLVLDGMLYRKNDFTSIDAVFQSAKPIGLFRLKASVDITNLRKIAAKYFGLRGTWWAKLTHFFWRLTFGRFFKEATSENILARIYAKVGVELNISEYTKISDFDESPLTVRVG